MPQLFLKLLSLNVDGITSKLADNDFLEFIERFDIISFQETFMEKNIIPNNLFTSFIKPLFSPAIKLSYQGRCSGGVIVLVKKYLERYVSRIIIKNPNCISIKLSNISFKDIVCIFPYIPCASSPFYNNQEVKNGITMLERCIYDIKTKYSNCSFLVMGDLNSRISNIQPVAECNIATRYLEDVNTSNFFMYNNIDHDRCSHDNIVNNFGRSLIEMCAAFNFIVLNGFCVGDTEGAYTFTSPNTNGDSVIDYCLVSDDLLRNVLNMTVHSRVDSWHMAISLTLKINKNLSNNNVKAVSYDKFVWNTDLVERFDNYWVQNDFQQNIIDTMLIMNTNIDLSGECIGAFSELLLNCAHMMRKSIAFNPAKPKCISTWYDKACYDKKRVVRKSLHKHAKSRCLVTKANYVQLRREYKSLLRAKRHSYCRDKTIFLLSSLNDSRVFWKEIRSVCIKPRVRCDIDIAQWYRYFKGVFQVPSTSPPICNEQFI